MHSPTGSTVQVAKGAVETSSMRKLLSMALNPGTSDVLYEHMAGVLCNITQHRVGRDLLVESDLHGLRAVVEMLGSPSDVKRTGAAAAIKNVVRKPKLRTAAVSAVVCAWGMHAKA